MVVKAPTCAETPGTGVNRAVSFHATVEKVQTVGGEALEEKRGWTRRAPRAGPNRVLRGRRRGVSGKKDEEGAGRGG